MEHDLAPFGGAIDDQNHVANLGGLESGTRNARFLHEQINVDESGKIETSADPSELSNLLSECCWFSIQSRSVEGASAAMSSCPRGEEAYPRRSSRKESNSSTRAELWVSSLAIAN